MQPLGFDAFPQKDPFAGELARSARARCQLSPPSGDSASMACEAANTASCDATMKSQASASANPAPTASPSTAAITGLGKRTYRLDPAVQRVDVLGLLGKIALAIGLQLLR